MSSAGRCRECGGVIPPGGPPGLCPKCLLTLAIEQAPGPDDADSQSGPEQAAGDLPETPQAEDSRNELSTTPVLTEKPGDKIGSYKLLEQIGQGGFGMVYMAEQSEPVKRRVALKIIKLGMDTRQVVARFEAERQALALMDHPNIAKILEAGATETGRPYFVMELVHGLKITDFCDQHRLSTAERLDLFVQICRAVQHAHQKGVIHRDIKPSNILVGVHDGAPVPKIIDFGIAKATQQELTEQTVFTQFGHFIGTPVYMSPEQAQLDVVDVDTRSDIYSLGVLLYELLTGRTPFEAKQLLRAGLEEMRRMIREKEPTRPSTRLRTMQEGDLTTTAQRRGAEPPKLLKLVRGDLDWIVMKCLEKDRARRYATANGLAHDIERHLNNEPIRARPPSRLYEFQKTVRRHKFGFAATATVILALSGGIIATSLQAIRARRAEREQSRLRQEATSAHRDATEKLWSSYVAQAHALRLSGEAGKHFETLATLRKAWAIWPSLGLSRESLLAPRNEAIAGMILPDIRWLRRKDFTKSGERVCLDSALERYAVCNKMGVVMVRRVGDDREEVRLPRVGAAATGVDFSPNGKFILASYDDGHWRVWDWGKPAMVLEVDFLNAYAFSPDNLTFAVFDTTNFILHDLIGASQLKSISLSSLGLSKPLGGCRFDPLGQRLALIQQVTNLIILDTRTGEMLQTLKHPEYVWSVAWHPDGKHLATGCGDENIRIWDSTTGERVRMWRADLTSLCFNHRGDVLAASGWGGYTTLWELGSGRELVSIHKNGPIVGFSPDDLRLATGSWEGTLLDIFEVAYGHGLRTPYKATEPSGNGGLGPVTDSSGTLAAFRTHDGLGLLDFQSGQQVSSPKFEKENLVGFDEKADNLLITLPEGLLRCPITKSGVEDRLSIGKAILVSAECADSEGGREGFISGNGEVCAVHDIKRCQTFFMNTFEKRAETGVQPGMRYGALNWDGSLFASGAWQHPGVKVWNTQTGAPVKELPTLEPATVAFSPDGRHLVTGVHDEYCFWEVGSWSLARRIPQDSENDFWPMMAFSRDGRIFAGTHSRNKIRLHDAATGKVLADLAAPNSRFISGLVFNHDGTLLAASESWDALRLWDLRRIRQQLVELGLDWDEPPYPAAEAEPAAPAGQSQANNRRP